MSLAFSLPLTAAVAVAKSTALRLVYTILEQLVSFAVGSVVGPLGTVALSLVYYDERVRKEAYDIQYLMEAASAGAAPVVQQPESIGATNVSA